MSSFFENNILWEIIGEPMESAQQGTQRAHETRNKVDQSRFYVDSTSVDYNRSNNCSLSGNILTGTFLRSRLRS